VDKAAKQIGRRLRVLKVERGHYAVKTVLISAGTEKSGSHANETTWWVRWRWGGGEGEGEGGRGKAVMHSRS